MLISAPRSEEVRANTCEGSDALAAPFALGAADTKLVPESGTNGAGTELAAGAETFTSASAGPGGAGGGEERHPPM